MLIKSLDFYIGPTRKQQKARKKRTTLSPHAVSFRQGRQASERYVLYTWPQLERKFAVNRSCERAIQLLNLLLLDISKDVLSADYSLKNQVKISSVADNGTVRAYAMCRVSACFQSNAFWGGSVGWPLCRLHCICSGYLGGI